MTTYLKTPIFAITLTILIYSLAKYISKKTKLDIFNPIALSMIAIIYILQYTKVDYNTYNSGTSIITFFLGPATVALAIPLYKKINLLRQNFLPIFIGAFVGSLTGITSVVVLGRAFKLDKTVILSMIPKSTTSAIAMDISTAIGGHLALTIVFVMITGLVGNIFGPSIFKLFKINNKIARGISLGTASHVIGTSKAVELGEVEGGMSSLAIGIAGLVTVFLAPLIIKFI